MEVVTMAAATDTPPATTAAPSPEQLAAWLDMLLRNEPMPDGWMEADLSGLTPPSEWAEAMENDQTLWTAADIATATMREVATVHGWRSNFLQAGVVSNTAMPPTVFDDVDAIRAEVAASQGGDRPKGRRSKMAVWRAGEIREWMNQAGLIDEWWRPVPERPGRPLKANVERAAKAARAKAAGD